jgi:hypothetical protein
MTAALIGLAVWLVLAVPVALFVGRFIALGLNSTHMPDDFDRHTREALAVVDETPALHRAQTAWFPDRAGWDQQ